MALCSLPYGVREAWRRSAVGASLLSSVQRGGAVDHEQPRKESTQVPTQIRPAALTGDPARRIMIATRAAGQRSAASSVARPREDGGLPWPHYSLWPLVSCSSAIASRAA